MVVFALFVGCEHNPASSTGDQITVNGRVVDGTITDTVPGIPDAKISTARINPDGSLEVINRDQAETDALGNFSTLVQSGGSQPIVLIARKDSSEWEALVGSAFETEQPEIQSVVNFESTAEIAVYRQIVKTGNQQRISPSMVRDYIGPEETGMILKDHSKILHFAEMLLERARSQARTRIEALVYDSTSFVQIRNNFLVDSIDDSTQVDSIIARFQMDPARVDSLLEIYHAEHDEKYGGWQDGAEGVELDRKSGDDEDEHHENNFLKIITYPNDHMMVSDTGRVAVKALYKFSTDSTERADLVAAIAGRTQLTRTQAEDAMMHRRDDHDGGWGDDDHDEDEDFGVDMEIHSNIALTQNTQTRWPAFHYRNIS